MFDITALGELLIDFTPFVLSNGTNGLFERNPGGAPANVLVASTRMRCSTAIIGMVGNDQFGMFLKDTMDIELYHCQLICKKVSKCGRIF